MTCLPTVPRLAWGLVLQTSLTRSNICSNPLYFQVPFALTRENMAVRRKWGFGLITDFALSLQMKTGNNVTGQPVDREVKPRDPSTCFFSTFFARKWHACHVVLSRWPEREQRRKGIFGMTWGNLKPTRFLKVLFLNSSERGIKSSAPNENHCSRSATDDEAGFQLWTEINSWSSPGEEQVKQQRLWLRPREELLLCVNLAMKMMCPISMNQDFLKFDLFRL